MVFAREQVCGKCYIHITDTALGSKGNFFLVHLLSLFTFALDYQAMLTGSAPCKCLKVQKLDYYHSDVICKSVKKCP